MIIVEKHIIKENHKFFKECDNLSFLSKNLYNQGLYNVRQHFFENEKYLNYNDNYHISKNQDSYKELPTKVACQTLKMIDVNFKSFFSLLKNKNIKNKIPSYLKKDGRYLVKFPKQSLSIKEFKKTGKIKLSKTNIIINTKITNFNNIKEVRIIHRNMFYVIEIVHERKEKEIKNNNIISSIDPGMNNLSTISFNNGNKPFIMNGRPLKSINHFYNKKLSFLKSELELKQKRKKSKRIIKITNKRNNKINDYLHKSSRKLVNLLVLNGVSTLIIGKNTSMKQDINLGKKTNQNFVQLPLFKYLDMICYKSKLEGIKVIFQEENYTSKCSFLDLETIQKHDKYKGKRIKRGLFESSTGELINADVNGSLNIMIKAIPNIFIDGIKGVGVHPFKLNV